MSLSSLVNAVIDWLVTRGTNADISWRLSQRTIERTSSQELDGVSAAIVRVSDFIGSVLGAVGAGWCGRPAAR